MEEANAELEVPKMRDIRRYYCEHCGICRSKRSLIVAHILSNHKEEMNEKEQLGDEEIEGDDKTNTCKECGACFKKPAYLKQHMQSHLLELRRDALDPTKRTPKCKRLRVMDQYQVGRPPEKLLQRPFTCPVDDCTASYRRKDHLTRHIRQHDGKLFKCSVENCTKEFTTQSNMKLHMKEDHDGHHSSTEKEDLKQHVCQEVGCGKSFKFPSQLKKHEDSHVKLDSVEAFCAEPGCMKYFTNEECLKEHVKSCHQYINCEICGTKQLKKNIKRHLRTHEEGGSSKKFNCDFEGCLHTFSNKSNLQQHVKAVHQGLKPFVCGFSGCGMRFSYKHVRDNHEKTGSHIYTCGDFVESDERFVSRPRGGQKRKPIDVEMLVRKRVMPPQSDFNT